MKTPANRISLKLLLCCLLAASVAVADFCIDPSDDARVDEGVPTTPKPSEGTVYVEASGDDNEFFLRFDVSGLQGTVVSGVLVMKSWYADSYGETHKIQLAEDDWDESTVTWNTKPDSSGVSDIGTWSTASSNELAVTSELQAAVDGDGVIAFRLYTTSAVYTEYKSKEGSTGPSRPKLRIQMANVYRSMGSGSTTELETGGSNSLTITYADGRATFNSDLGTDVGVGDIIEYDNTGDATADVLAVIHKRISAKVFQVMSTTNDSAVGTSGGSSTETWKIFRAYTSTTNAESGIENTGIASALRNFDDWTGGGTAADDDVGKDIRTAEQIWQIALYEDALETVTSGITIDGWTTSPTYYLRFFTPCTTTEAGVSQRHDGDYDESDGFAIKRTNDGSLFNIDDDNVHFDGLQTFPAYMGSYFADGGGHDSVHIYNCILKGNSDGHLGRGAITMSTGASDERMFIRNCVLFDQTGSYGGVHITYSGGGQSIVYLYNSTFYNCAKGIYNRTSNSHILIKNCLFQSCTDGYYTAESANLIPGSDYNISNVAGDFSNTNDQNGVTLTLAGTASDDYGLASGDAEAIDDGIDLSSDSIMSEAVDYEGNARESGNWDIGADEWYSTNSNPVVDAIDNYNTGAYTADNTPTLQFDISDPDAGDIIKYQIQVDIQSNFATASSYVDVTEASGSATARTNVQYTTTSLSDNSYYWRVKAIDDDAAESAWSTANGGSVAFIVDATAPTNVGLSLPTNTDTDVSVTPTLTIKTATDAGSGLHSSGGYYIQLATDDAFTQNVQNSGWQSGTTWQPSTLAGNTTYYWQVKARDDVSNESSYYDHSSTSPGYASFTTVIVNNYRSVGPGATAAIAEGTASNKLTISGTTATFDSDLPDSVGVGDVIQYDSDDGGTVDAICFIHGRTSATEFTVKSASGTTPTATSVDDDTWDVFRAYTSLNNAESGIENTGINTNYRNFDDWTAGGDATTDDEGKDLTASGEIWHIACYDGFENAADNTMVLAEDWATSSSNYLRIYTPTETSEVGERQRHYGTWNSDKYRLVVSDNHAMDIAEPNEVEYIRIEGLQIEVTGTANDKYGIIGYGHTDVRVGNCVIRENSSGTGTRGISITFSEYILYNNIIYDFADCGIWMDQPGNYQDCKIYNNTLYNCNTGLGMSSSPANTYHSGYVSNNLAVDNSTADFEVNYASWTGADEALNNATSDATGDDFNNSSDCIVSGVTAANTFLDATNRDLRIKSSSPVKNNGADLESDGLYDDDIEGETRESGNWDIGADENLITEGTLTSVSVTHDTLMASKLCTVTIAFTTVNAIPQNGDLQVTFPAGMDITRAAYVSGNSGASLSLSGQVLTLNLGTAVSASENVTIEIAGIENPGTSGSGGTYAIQTKNASDLDLDNATASANTFITKHIFRSVGPSKTVVVTTRTGDLTIAGIIATFDDAVCDSMGVGDAIEYDADDAGGVSDICFVHGRLSSTQFIVHSVSGATPTATSGAISSWDVWRAYTSLAKAESGDENDAIHDNVEAFEDWVDGKGISTSDEVWNIACYGDAVDNTIVELNGWTTSASCYLRIFTPTESDQVGTSQRHNGYWDDDKYRIDVSSPAHHIIRTYTDVHYVRIEGLQVKATASSGAYGGIVRGDAEGGSDYRVSHCIVVGVLSGTASSCEGIKNWDDGNMRIWNNIVYGWSADGNSTGIQGNAGTIHESSSTYIYNNTVYDCDVGIDNANASYTAAAINNIVQNCTNGYNGTFAGGSDYNISHLASDAPSSSYRDGLATAVTFVDATNKNFLLSSATSYGKDEGTDLSDDSNLSFDDDITGTYRVTDNWDIGAHELIPQLTSPSVTHSELSTFTVCEVTVSFTTGYAVPVGGKVQVTFPSGMDVSRSNIASGNAGASVSVNGQVVTITLGTAVSASEAVALVLSSVRNPTSSGSGGTYAIETQSAAGGKIEEGTASANTFITGIYRSAGPGNTDALNQGSDGGGNNLTVSNANSTAKFASALADTIGVGDCIQYDSDDDNVVDVLCFIHGRISADSFLVRSSTGGAPTATSADDDDWTIYRSYSTLAGAAGLSENSSIAISNFDVASMDLDANGYIWNIAVYGDGADAEEARTSLLRFDLDITTDSDNYLRVYTPYDTNEVGVSQRHSGTWNESQHHLVFTAQADYVRGVECRTNGTANLHIRFEGLQVYCDNTGNHGGAGCFKVDSYIGAANEIQWNDNICKMAGASGYAIYSVDGGTFHCYNNIIYSESNTPQGGIWADVGTWYIHNNTISGYDEGIDNDAAASEIKNNVVFNTGNDFTLQGSETCDNNASDDLDGTNAINISPGTESEDWDSAFVDYANKDFRVRHDGSRLANAGVDLSEDSNSPFATDAEGDPRQAGLWDIGADEFWTGVICSLSATDAVATESGPTTGTWTVTRFGSTSGDLTVYYRTSGTATTISDYSELTGSVTILDGQATATITLTPVDDNNYEGDETVILTLKPNFNYNRNADSSATITIEDDEEEPAGDNPEDQYSGELVRSVGITATSLYSTGTITISSNIATFSNPFLDNIGVGDMIEYTVSSTVYLACIKGINSSRTRAYVKEPDDTDAIAASGETFNIYRAYASLAKWESQDENDNFDDNVENFDAQLNLTTLTKIMNVACYKDGDDENVDIDGWTTDATYYIRIFTPYEATEVGTSQRHDGTEGSGYTVDPTSAAHGIRIADDYVRVEGIEVTDWSTNYDGSLDGINIEADNAIIDGCLVYSDGHGTETDADCRGINFEDVTGTPTATIRNCIIYDIGGNGITIRQNVSDATLNVYNTTVYNCMVEDPNAGGNIEINAGSNNTINCFNVISMDPGGSHSCYNLIGAGASWGTSDYNVCSDNTAPGTNSLKSYTATETAPASGNYIIFNDITAGTEDLLLQNHADNDAIDAGTNGSGFTNDIHNDARISGSWDIGADEVKGTLTPTVTHMTLVVDSICRIKLAFQTVTALSIGDKVSITFGSGFNIASADFMVGNSGASMAVFGQTATITLGTAINATTDTDLWIDSVQNPASTGSGGSYTVKTLNSSDQTIEEGTGSANTFVAAPTDIYRSVGPGNTSDLNTAPRTVEISNDTAYFSGNMPTNVGIGDVLEYPATPANLAFIHKRISADTFVVKSAAGANPTAATAGTAVSVYRAYTSLVNAEKGTENTAFDDGLENFDTWTNGKNLTSSTERWHIACYADAADDGVCFEGWTTSDAYFPHVFAPLYSYQAGASQRHNGVWSTSYYRIDEGDATACSLVSKIANLHVEGIQLNGGTREAFRIPSNGVAGETWLWKSIVKSPGGDVVGVRCDHTLKTWNSIFYTDVTGTGTEALHTENASAIIYAYNITAHAENAEAVKAGNGGNLYAVNVLAKGSDTYGFVENTGTLTLNYCASNDGTADDFGGTGNDASQTFTFANEGSDDFRLGSDAGAQDLGVDLSSDTLIPFDDDIQGYTRYSGTAWDIGADEWWSDPNLAVKMDMFVAIGGDKADTLLWRTQSEDNNAGYNLYRRIKPEWYLAKLQATNSGPQVIASGKVPQDGETTEHTENTSSSSVPSVVNSSLAFADKYGNDTTWTIVNMLGLIPGAPGGRSVGTRNYRFIDIRVENGITYEYILKDYDYDGTIGEHGPVEATPLRAIPKVFALHQNYPNPFNPVTRINYDLPIDCKVALAIYNMQGRRIITLVQPDKKQEAGYYHVIWKGVDHRNRPVASGVYFYRMNTPKYVKVRKMMMLK